jgi:hypothetical protein
MSQLLNLADNPLFVKHVRSRLRRGTLLPQFIVIGFLCICLIFADQNLSEWRSHCVGSYLFYILQSLILGLMGGSQVATSVAYVRESGILDFHRVTPVPPARQVLGFLLGAPIREWILFAFTLPFALACALLGNWGLNNFVMLLIVQISTALFFHTMAVVIGMSGKAKGASGRLVGTIFFFHFAAIYFYIGGVYGPAYFTTIPVHEDLRKEAVPQMRMRVFRGGEPAFFAAKVPAVVQTLGFQASIGVFLFIAATRRFRSARLPIFTKLQALTLLSVITFLTLGSVWEWGGVPLVLTVAYLVTFSGVWLSAPISPPIGEFSKGLQRAYKKGETNAPTWSDLASNKLVVFTFGMVLAAATAVVLTLAPQGGNLPPRFTPWAPLTAGVLTILSFGWGLQFFHLKYEKRALIYFNMMMFFLWVAPLIIGGLLIASRVPEAFYLMAVSPVIGIWASSQVGIPIIDGNTLLIMSIGPPAFLTVLFGLRLLAIESLRRREVVEEHAPRQTADLEG